MYDSITLKHIGYRITGESLLNLWGGGQGHIGMNFTDITGHITKEKLLSCINDNGFGCESVENVEFCIYDLYEHEHTEHNRNIFYSRIRTINKFAFRGI